VEAKAKEEAKRQRVAEDEEVPPATLEQGARERGYPIGGH